MLRMNKVSKEMINKYRIEHERSNKAGPYKNDGMENYI